MISRTCSTLVIQMPDLNQTHCLFNDKRTTISLRDKGSRVEYRAENPKKYEIQGYKVDGGVISQEQGKACDYLLLTIEKKQARLIEIKGRDLPKALKQIESSLNHFEKVLKDQNLFGRIVLSKNGAPRIMNTPPVLKLKKRLKNLGGNLIVQSQQMTETL